jgi:hypothetical protein
MTGMGTGAVNRMASNAEFSEAGDCDVNNSLEFGSCESTPTLGPTRSQLKACWLKTCLHPRNSFRTQLILSFGLISSLSIFVIICSSSMTIHYAGKRIKDFSRQMFQIWTEKKLASSSQIIAESLTAQLNHLKGLPAILTEVTRDRFIGYPDHPGYDNDTLVAFVDHQSGKNVYPLKARKFLPLNWEFDILEITEENASEYLNGREHWFDNDDVGTSSACMMFQGNCNPELKDPAKKGYFPNCTIANNDHSGGGIIQPTSVYKSIYEKSSDYATAVLKPLFESHDVVKSVGIYFANDGAGASVYYPPVTVDGTYKYTSAGCNWLLQPNPFLPSKTIGTNEMVSRCQPNGTDVETYFYNPLERDWCREQALDPSKVQIYGPYEDAFSPYLVMTVGQAVYDKITSEFIACTLADVSVKDMAKEVEGFNVMEASEISFVKWNDGSVVASTKWKSNSSDLLSEVKSSLFNLIKQEFTAHLKEGHSIFEFIVNTKEKIVSFSPVPLPLSTDSQYVPEFAVLLSFEREKVYAQVDELDDNVETSIQNVLHQIIIAGVVGIFVIFLSISLISMYLAIPLQWISDIGSQMIQSVGNSDKKLDFHKISSWLRFSPKTEITSLVRRFQRFVKRFSGIGSAKLHMFKGMEIKNHITKHEDLMSLYQERSDNDFIGNYELEPSNPVCSQLGVTSFIRLHHGPNIHNLDVNSSHYSNFYHEQDIFDKTNFCSSPLFWWILATIAIPLTLLMIGISSYVIWSVSHQLPFLTTHVKDTFINFELRSLSTLAVSRANFAANVIAPVIRDAHLLNRISGWLSFGALDMALSVSSMVNVQKKCDNNAFDGAHKCTYYQEKSELPCECSQPMENKSFVKKTCSQRNTDLPALQRVWWIGESMENTTLRSEISSLQTNIDINSNRNASTIDLLHLSSSLSVVRIPLFNYIVESRPKGTISFSVFENGGIVSGYSGCEYVLPTSIETMSCSSGDTYRNFSCGPQYVDAKEAHLNNQVPIFFAPPSRSVSRNEIRQQVVLPIQESDYIGQTIMDFSLAPILESLTADKMPLAGNGFPVLIKTDGDDSFHDIIVAPGYNLSEDLKEKENVAVEDYVMPFDICEKDEGIGCNHRNDMKAILQDMRNGKSGFRMFTRNTEGGEDEQVFWTFAPVYLNIQSPVNNSDISRGISTHTKAIYSLALAIPISALHTAFNPVQGELDTISRIATIALTILIALVVFIVIYLSTKVTASIIIPVTLVLKFLKLISSQSFNEDIPDISGGSREVIKVFQTLEHLRTVIKLANTAFFSGDLGSAYQTLREALELFIKLENEKAIGISYNNLGNIMLAMYRTSKTTGFADVCGLSKENIILNGSEYFKKSIDIGEIALSSINKNEGWSTNYLVFMQQLSNRYFNRAVFLLNVKDEHPDPADAERQALIDLSIAKAMDREVVDNGDHQGFKGDSDVFFDLLLGRIKGIRFFAAMGFEDHGCVEDLLLEAKNELIKGLSQPGHTLFRTIEPAGQMQRLDAALIEHFLGHQDEKSAALVAIRMVIEDDYLNVHAAHWALLALESYILSMESNLCGEFSELKVELHRCKEHIEEVILSSAPLSLFLEDGGSATMRDGVRQLSIEDISMEFF